MYKLTKRLMDVLISVVLIISFILLYVLIFFVNLLFYESPVLYSQRRIGENGKTFNMIKFRTLSADTSKPLLERRYLLGNILRFTNLDELPQCWNVLKGEMSIIGPRPLPTEYLQLLTTDQQKRHLVRPGITGLAQVNGKNDISWEKKFELDLNYVSQISFYLDLVIMFKTIFLIFSFKKDSSLTEKKFSG